MTGVIFLILRILLALCLYAFLGWALYTLWRELQMHSTAVQARPSPTLMLVCQDYDSLTASFSGAEVTLGRDATCDYVIPDETISSYHARFSYHHSQWWVEDMQSTNGTFLNEERLYTPTVVISGDVITLGKISVSISIEKKSN